MEKKIVCLIESLGSGGAERQMVLLATLLKKKGYDVSVLTYYPESFYVSVLQQANVPYESIRETHSRIKRLFLLRKKLKSENPDVVIAYLDGATMLACLLKLSGLGFRLIVSERNTTQKRTFRESFKFFLYRNAAESIVPNSYAQALFIEKNYPYLKGKTTVVHNYVDRDIFVPCFLDRKDTNTCQVLVVARITPQKNVLLFLQALYQLKCKGYDMKVKWVGSSPDGLYRQQVRSMVEELRLQDFIIFETPQKDILKEYRAADVFCLPSLFEGFPNVVGEAICCGLPILCSNVCDNTYLVHNGANGFLFSPNEIDSIVNAFETYFSLSKDEKSALGKASRAHAELLFSSDDFVSKYEKLLG